MRKIVLLIFLFICAALPSGILFSRTNGEELSFEQKHSDKDAVGLLLKTEITVKDDWSYTVRKEQKIKILKKEARDLGECYINYEKGREKITVERATSITPDGKKHRYTKIQDIQNYKDYPSYSDWMTKIITLPEANIGTVLDVATRETSRGLQMKKAFWRSFDFDDFVRPVKELKYSISWPKKLNIQFKAFNLKHDPVITRSGSTVTYSWHLTNIDNAVLKEEYLPPPSPETAPGVAVFSSIPDWRVISDWFHSLVEKNLRIDRQIEEAAKAAVSGQEGVRNKTRAVLEYMQTNFRYVAMSFGDHSLVPHPADSVFRNKYGDCKDLALLCMALLRVAGINSHLVLFNGEFSMFDPEYQLPCPDLFSHAILLVEDKEKGDFYADPLLDGYDIEQYPHEYQCAHTFIVTPDGGKFGRFPVFDEKWDSDIATEKVIIGLDGSALTEESNVVPLDRSIELRKGIKSKTKEELEKTFQAFDESLAGNGKLLERRIEGLDRQYGMLAAFVKVKREGVYPVTDGMIIIDIPEYERPDSFLKKERENPIFSPNNYFIEKKQVFVIPKGFKVSYLPENLDLDNGFFSFKREYSRKGSQVICRQMIRNRRAQLPKESYGLIKDFYNKLPVKTKQRIILKRVNPGR